MGFSRRSADPGSTRIAVKTGSELAERRFAAVARRDLLAHGIGDARIRSWVRGGRLHPKYPGVYAWGRGDLTEEGELAAGLLYAGRGSALTGLSMLWWRELLGRRPDRIHIDAPGKVSSYADLEIRHPLEIRRSVHRGLPVAALPDALPVAARHLSPNALRLVLARAEFQHVCTLAEIEAGLRQGVRGGAAVRAALSAHLPQLARCANRWERAFVLLCEAGGVEIPEPNARIGRYRPDMLWEGAKLIVELDGGPAHSTPAQRAADAARQRHLESCGYRVLRFAHDEVEREPERVLSDVRAALAQGFRADLHTPWVRRSG